MADSSHDSWPGQPAKDWPGWPGLSKKLTESDWTKDFEPLVIAMARKALAELPKPKDGDPGKAAEIPLDLLRAEVARAVAALPPPKVIHGTTPKIPDALINEKVRRAVAALPPARNGEDAKLDYALILKAIEKEVAKVAIPELEVDDVEIIDGSKDKARGKIVRKGKKWLLKLFLPIYERRTILGGSTIIQGSSNPAPATASRTFPFFIS